MGLIIMVTERKYLMWIEIPIAFKNSKPAIINYLYLKIN